MADGTRGRPERGEAPAPEAGEGLPEGKKRFLLRLDPPVWKALERWAADELRSVNGQIEFLLKEALRRSGRGGGG